MIIEKTISFFVDNFPSLRSILVGGPTGLLGGVKAQRSCEGSAAVFVVSLLAIIAGAAILSGERLVIGSLGTAIWLAFGCMILEAISPHGWDNAVLQIVPSLLVKLTMPGL